MSPNGGLLGRLRRLAAEMKQAEDSDALRSQFFEVLPHPSPAFVGPPLLELFAEGVEMAVIQRMSGWCQESWADAAIPRELGAEHPLETFRRENEVIRSRAEQCCRYVPQVTESSAALDRVVAALRELAEIDCHYRRQEFLLFTRLETRNLVRPGRVLWAAHDEIRQWLRYLDLQFASEAFDATSLAGVADSVVGPLISDIENVVFLEESLLFPMAWEVLEEEDWAVVRRHSAEIGWALIAPPSDDRPPAAPADLSDDAIATPRRMPTGSLRLEEWTRIHKELPVDLTFVDAEDRVCYFTEGTRPVFYRSQAILGRDVRNCHPPRSVHYVEQILSDFKAGRENSAQFWKRMGDRFVHIRFVAIRDSNGNYQGTLEVAQDLTPVRALEGEQKELRYDRKL